MTKKLNNAYINAKEKVAHLLHINNSVHTIQNTKLPQGQKLVDKMVAMAPITFDYPHIDKSQYSLKIYGSIQNEITLKWQDILQMGEEDFVIDFHCVTKWSKLNQNFTGVDFTKILSLVKPLEKAQYIIFEGYDGYTTNIPLKELAQHVCIIATKMDHADIPDKYGGPVRAVIPYLYGWKSTKFLSGIRFTEKDERGFWEVRGYHNHADPWKEERYSDQE